MVLQDKKNISKKTKNTLMMNVLFLHIMYILVFTYIKTVKKS